MVGVMQEHGVALSGSHVADVGLGAEQIPAAGGQLHQKGPNGERREKRARKTAQQQVTSAYGPRLDRRDPRGLSGTVCGLRILPLRADLTFRAGSSVGIASGGS